MTKKSFAELLHKGELMVSGIRKNLTPLAEVGLNAQKANELQQLCKEAQALDLEQERLKSMLKTKTEEINAKIKDLNDSYSKARKQVKLEIPKSGWTEFGINDKR